MKNNKNYDENEYSLLKPSGEPEDVTEILNKYGTYNVQDTADTGNEFPAIAQGLPDSKKNISIDKNKLKHYGADVSEE